MENVLVEVVVKLLCVLRGVQREDQGVGQPQRYQAEMFGDSNLEEC